MKTITSRFIFLLLLVFSACKPELNNADTALPPGSFPIDYRGYIIIQGAFEEKKGNFVFDTGASLLALDSTYYSSNDFFHSRFEQAGIFGIGLNSLTVPAIMDTIDFSFGNKTYSTNYVPIVQFKEFTGDYVDGVIGRIFFNDAVVEINYAGNYMKFHQNTVSIETSEYSHIKLVRKGDRRLVPLSIKLNDSLKITGEFLLDLGSGGTVSLTNEMTNRYSLSENILGKVFFCYQYGGTGGPSSFFEFKADSLKLGEFSFSSIPMDFSLDSLGAMSTTNYSGIFGNGILDRFDVVLDFVNDDMYIKPNESLLAPFKFSRLGFSFVNRSQTKNAWIVIGLYENSHADEQGLKIGDRIISVNGIEVENIHYKKQRDMLNNSKELDLIIQREDEFFKMNITLESIQNLFSNKVDAAE